MAMNPCEVSCGAHGRGEQECYSPVRVLGNRTCQFNDRWHSQRHARRLQSIKHSTRTKLAIRQATSFKVHLSLVGKMRSGMQHAVNPGCGNLFSRLEDFHTPPSNLDAALQGRYRRLTAREGSVGLPPRGITATPAGGSKSGWHRWQ